MPALVSIFPFPAACVVLCVNLHFCAYNRQILSHFFLFVEKTTATTTQPKSPGKKPPTTKTTTNTTT